MVMSMNMLKKSIFKNKTTTTKKSQRLSVDRFKIIFPNAWVQFSKVSKVFGQCPAAPHSGQPDISVSQDNHYIPDWLEILPVLRF